MVEGTSLLFIAFLAGVIFAGVYLYFFYGLNDWWKKVFKSLLFVAALIFLYGFIYQWGMATFEGFEKSYIHSIQVVIESITTSGYGGDAPWKSDFMNIFVVWMNLTGVILVFLAFPLFVFPMIREAIQPHPPESVNLEDHVIICSISKRVSILQDELHSKSIPYVIIDLDEDAVLDLNQNGTLALWGNPSDRDVLESANIEKARALVADMDDENNALITLTARSLRDDLKILSVATEENVIAYHQYAGATNVILPRRILGQSLAERVIVSLSKDLQGVTQLSDELELTEILIEPKSDIVGKSIQESKIRQRFGVNIIGAWFWGNFVANPKPNQVINEHTILLLAGPHDKLTEFRTKTTSKVHEVEGPIIVAGLGVVGRTIAALFQENDIQFTVVDIDEKEGVDVIGDITEEEILKEAGIENASTIILAVNDDRTAIFTTLVLKKVNPEIEIIARVSDVENIGKLYQAGADYVLSLPTVSGRMLFSILVEDDEVLSANTMYEVVRIKAPELDGKSLEGANIRAETGCTIVAVERNGHLVAELGPSFELHEDDQLIVVGSDETINAFRKKYS
ncbi:potassium channel family protein [Rhodohalobacter sp. 614A]|uniref:potassium channel family protein n=1 Tax=Rhodohalobacter sp. 614A TaxID=2908649 RepID=UPI001F37D29A|nr:NAD-binding protein [Rhodohalobacter sp. 614A]